MYLLIMIDTLLLRPSLHFTQLHITPLHYACRHFTLSHLTSPSYTSLHFTTLSFGLTPFKIPNAPFHLITTLHCIPFPSTLFHQLVFHPPSLHLAIYILVYLSALFPNSYIILFWEFCFLPFYVHAQTCVICLTLLSL